MADDPLLNIFGATPEPDPLAAAFGTPPAPEFGRHFNPPPPGPLVNALEGGGATERVAHDQQIKDAVGPPGEDQSVPGYLAHGLESGLYAAGGMAGDIAESFNPVSGARNLWLDIKDTAHQLATIGHGVATGNKREILVGDNASYLKKEAGKDASTPFTRFAERMQRESQDLASTPDGQKYNELVYATTDPEKSALLSPVRMVHDALQSLPSTAAMATTVYLTRGAALKSYSEAIAAGFTKAEANAIAVKAAGKIAMLAGAVGEGTVGGVQQGTQTRVQLLDGKNPEKSPVYQAMVKAGVSPEDAKQYIATEAGSASGLAAGLVDAATNVAEGPILGRIISEGGPVVSRVGKGFLTEGVQEGVQGAGEQVSQNAVVKAYADPQQQLADGVAENVLSSFVVGGLTGATFTGVGGAGMHHDDTGVGAAAPAGLREAGALDVEITPQDEASPLPTDLITQGKMTMGASEGTTKANQALRANGMPDVGTRVTVSHAGRSQKGAIADVWTVDVAGQTQTGVKIRMDDGTMIEEPVATLADMGVEITPEALPGGYADDPEVRRLLAERDATVAATNLGAQNIPENIPTGEIPLTVPHSAKPGSNGAHLPMDVVQGLIAHGIPEHVARGAAAGVSAEARGGDHTAVNPTSGAFGLGQWLGSRKDALIARYGPNPTRQQQIEFLAYELKGGDAGGAAVLAAKDEAGALDAYVRKFMRPAAGAETTGDLDRGKAALGVGGVQRDMFGGAEISGAQMDAKRAVDAVEQDDSVDKGDLLDAAHSVLEANVDRPEDMAHNASLLGIRLGTNVTPEEAPDYARAVLQRFGDEEHGRAVGGRKLSDQYTAFAEHTGSLGIPRDQMPQIKAEHRGAMVNFLNARGIDHEEVTLPAHALKPSQAEFSPEKVAQAKAFEGGDRAILIDESNHVVDGHHQYVAAHDRGEDVRAIRLNAPVSKIATELKDMPSAETAGGSTMDFRPGAQVASTSESAPSAGPTIVKGGFKTPQQAGMWLKSNKLSTSRYQVEGDQAGAYRVIDTTQAETVAARPELGPTSGDPQGDLGESAVLRAISEGRHSTKDPLTGNWKWALRNNYATEGKKGSLHLTDRGRLHLKHLDVRSGRADADRERAASTEGHPGLVVKSLRTGEETTIQPIGTVAPKQAAMKEKMAAKKGGGKKAEKEAAAAAEKERADKALVETRAENARRDAEKIAEWKAVDFTKPGAPLPNWRDRRVVMKKWVVGEPDYAAERRGESRVDVQGELKAMLENEGLAVSWGQEQVYRLEQTDKGWTVFVDKTMDGGENNHTFFVGKGLTRQEAVDQVFADNEPAWHIGLEGKGTIGRGVFDIRVFKDPDGRYFYDSDRNYSIGGGSGPTKGYFFKDRFDTLQEAKDDALNRMWDAWRSVVTRSDATAGDKTNWKKVQELINKHLSKPRTEGGERDKAADQASILRSANSLHNAIERDGEQTDRMRPDSLDPAILDEFGEKKNAWETGYSGKRSSVESAQFHLTNDINTYWDRYGERPKLPIGLQVPGRPRIEYPSEAAASTPDKVQIFAGVWTTKAEADADAERLGKNLGEGERAFVEPENGNFSVYIEKPKPAEGTVSKVAIARPGDVREAPTNGAEAPSSGTKAPSGYGESNKFFTKGMADKARETIRDKLKTQLNSGFDPELLAAGMQIAGFHMEAGARKFADLARAVADDLGVKIEELKPYLAAWYNGARDMLEGQGEDIDGMDGPGAVRAALSMIADSGKDKADANSEPSPERAEGSQPAGVQPTESGRSAGRVGPGEDVASEGNLRPADRSGGETAERSGEGPGAESGSGRASDRGSNGRPDRPGPDGSTGQNYVIRPGALDEARGPKQKARDNLEAVRIVKHLASEDRFATPEEQNAIARYVGWGGLKNVFPDQGGMFGKGFEDVGSELRGLLTPDEYETARRSIQYAHYTSETIVREMWRAVQRLGFDEGQIFEPGMGTGNFPGMIPDALRGRGVHYQGIEFDGITAAIAKALYPHHGVTQADYTAYEAGKDAFRLAIGNPPFSETVVKADPAYRTLGMVLHDYFFAKTLDAVQPGGALAFVTSTGTMNKIDSKARDYLAERAWLAGAVRLPGGAFAKNAGTEVTTDIIFLVKKVPGEERPAWAAPDSWTGTVGRQMPNKDGGMSSGQLSNYFAANPDQVLGEQGFFSPLWPGRMEVKSDGRDLGKALAEAIDRLPEGVMGTDSTQIRASTADFDVTEAKNGSYYVKDGKLYQKQGGLGREIETRGKGSKAGLSEPEHAIVRDLIPIRDGLREVYTADLGISQGRLKEGMADGARQALNKAYDAFVAKHGPINKGVFTARRPNRVSIESTRRRAREEARAQGHEWDDGSFDPSELYDSGATVADVARVRAEMRESYKTQGQPWDEGTFSDEEVPDTIIEKRPNIDPFKLDPENYRLRSIEHYDDQSGEAQKGRVFFESVIAREEEPDIKNATDALFHVLNKAGRVDLDEIAHLAKASPADVAVDLAGQIFFDPEAKEWQHSTVYLSGNIRQKLEQARSALGAERRYQANADALEAVMPPDLGKSEVRARLGMPWIPADDVVQFVTSELGLAMFNATYQPRIASWAVSGDKHSAASVSTFGTTRRNAVDLLGDALNGQSPKIYDTWRDDAGEHRVFNAQETQAAQDKLTEIKEKFGDWIWRDDERASRLLEIYNERFNSHVAPEWDGSYLTTPGVTASWNWRPHQLRGIARIVQSGNTYLGHAVGAGKTATMIASAMEMKRLGLVSKPMVVVPNHMLGQFTKEWYELYPLAKLAIADEENFHTDRRKQFVSDVALNDLDGVVITHSAFGLIPMSQRFEAQYMREQLDELRSILSEVDKSERITRRKIEQQIEQAEQRLRAVTTRRRDQTFTFEELGVDFVNVDEAHMFRKLDFATRKGDIKGIDPNGSMRAMDLFIKTRYLEQRRPGRSHVLASGTSITNTMAELYTLSRFLQPDELKARGIDRFDAWSNAFGDTVTDLEPTAGGTYKSQTRFAQFVNVPELSVMVRQIMDVVTSSQLDEYVVRPKVERELINVPMTAGQKSYQALLAHRMELIEKRTGKPQKGDDIILSVIGDGRKSAIDMRLVDAAHDRESTKLEQMIGDVFETWKDTAHHPFYGITPDGYTAEPVEHGPATQMVFSSLGVSDAMDFNVHRYIRNEIIKRGVPKDQVVLFNQVKTTVAKQKVFNDMNAGKVRVLIGSSDKMGTGVNAQRRLYANSNLDPEWLPSTDEQRNGRIIRQGNMNREIRIRDYATKGTYDSQMWGIMARKAKFIEGFFRGDPTLRDMDDLGEASTYEQAKALTTKDPRILELTEAKLELEKEIRRRNAHENEQATARRKVSSFKAEAGAQETRLGLEKADAAKVTDIKGDAFKATVQGKEFTDRQEFQAALDAEMEKDTLRRGLNAVGEIGGMKLALLVTEAERVSFSKDDGTAHKTHFVEPVLRLAQDPDAVEARYAELSKSNTAVSAQATLARIKERPTSTQTRIDQLARSQSEFEARARDTSEYAGMPKIRELQAKVDKITAELKAENDRANAAKGAPQSEPKGQAAPPRETIELSSEDVDRIREGLLQRMAELGIDDRVSLDVAHGLKLAKDTTLGQYDPYWRLISIALDRAPNPQHSLNHEAIHAVRDLGLVTPEEWSVLVETAWADDRLRKWAQTSAAYQGLSLEDQQEEAAAEYFADQMDYAKGRAFEGEKIGRVESILARAAYRVGRFLNALRHAVAYLRTGKPADLRPIDVVVKLDKGEVGRRDPMVRGRTPTIKFGRRITDRKLKEQSGFHGTPHDFNEFSTDHVGTGEGAQAYGWGLYFASSEAVGRHYREKLSDRRQATVLWNGDDINTLTKNYGMKRYTEEMWDSLEALSAVETAGNIEGALYKLRSGRGAFGFNRSGVFNPEGALRWLEAHKDEVKVTPPGRLFQVDLPENDELLDWDAPFRDQSPRVKAALHSLPEVSPYSVGDRVDGTYEVRFQGKPNQVLKPYATRERAQQIVDSFNADFQSEDFLKGKDIYQQLAQRLADTSNDLPEGNGWQVAKPTWRADPKAASAALVELGIPGHRYFDGMSRARGDGSHNFVMYDASRVRVEAKAQAAPPPGGGGGIMGKLGLTRPVKRDAASGLFEPDTEKRWTEAAKGIGDGPGMLTRMNLAASRIGQAFSRHWIDLPNVPKYAELQQELRKLEAAPSAAKERAVRHLKQVLTGLTRADMDLFARKIVTDDLAWEADSEHELPFGFTPETLSEARRAIDAELAGKQHVVDAVRRRKALNRTIAQELVTAGVLDAERLKNPAYYRHVVLSYAQAEAAAARVKGVGKKLRSPRWAKRMGSSQDINANYLEAEFDWLAKALVDIPTAKAISWIGDSEHNILPGLRDQAKAHNKAAMDALLAAERKEYGDGGGPLDEALKGFRQRIAMGFKYLEDAIDSSHLDIPPSLQSSFDSLGTGKEGDPFPFLSWLLDTNGPGANGAAVILKAISQRRVFTAKVLGRNFIDPTDAEGLVKRLAPEGYATWSPDDARLLFTVKTMPEHAIDAMLEKIDAAPGGVKGDDIRAMIENVRSALAFGGMRYAMVLPDEVASTLNALRREDFSGLIDAVAEKPLKLWKQWVLINPRRVLKYNLNNLSGDLDATIAGRGIANGAFWKQVGRAALELGKVMGGRGQPSARYEEAIERGVFDSGLSIQEIPDINRLSAFANLTEGTSLRPDKALKKVLGKTWGALRGTTQWRENVLRYAAYLEFAHRLEAGESMLKIGYGASLPAMVDAVQDPRDRAALLARDLLGDYGNVSHAGQEIRRKLIPFWSWMEINAKRYWRLSSNAFAQGRMQGLATGGLLGAGAGVRTTVWLTTRMFLMFGLMQLWNHLLFPDEEDDLGEDQRRQLHLILGRTEDGQVETIRLQGALSDALSWFGLADASDALRDYELGRGPWYDVLLAPPKATINRIGTSLSPLFTLPFESISGKKLWPDMFATRFIRDRWRNVFQTFSLENEYDLLADKPSRGYAGSFVQSLVYSRDPGENAYNDARGIAYDWLKRTKGQDGGMFSSNRADALYAWRAARRFDDADAEKKAVDQLIDLGVTDKDLKQSIKRAHPLGPIAKKDRKAFLASLTDDELKTFAKAEAWYKQRYLEGPQ